MKCPFTITDEDYRLNRVAEKRQQIKGFWDHFHAEQEARHGKYGGAQNTIQEQRENDEAMGLFIDYY